ncbi:MAG: hypothetical protein EP310_01295 [Bacteroidetes bacterium]|nr:MAG: hypothetical protein EP310_01295 [Bacteroidota bacterium]
MENKKLLKYLLKDLNELDEMFSEKEKNSFDEMEMEFIQNRVSGAKKLIQLIIDRSNDAPAEIQPASVTKEKPGDEKSSVLKEKTVTPQEAEMPKNRWVEAGTKVITDENSAQIIVGSIVSEIKSETKIPGTILSEIQGTAEAETGEEEVEEMSPKIETNLEDNQISVPVKEKISEVEKNEPTENDTKKSDENKHISAVQQELEMEDEDPVDIHHKRLGDRFLKEKSVNDIIGDDFSKLEHKLSNRPINSIQAAIGINDRFQYIRELFEGSADSFAKTVADLDSMNDLKEAVNYLQTHFKWKKNETSLKFVSLIKRRFPNE